MRKFSSENNYVYMLIGLLCLIIFQPYSGMPIISSMTTHLSFLLVMFIGIWSINRKTFAFRLSIVLAFLCFFSSIMIYFINSVIPQILALTSVLVFCITSSIIALKHVMFSGKITLNKIIGSICIYLLIGVTWGILYNLLVYFQPGAFKGLSLAQASEGDFMYYSFVTLSTVGYGDISPVSPLARALAYLEAIVGQFYLAVLVASLVGASLSQRKA